MTTQAVSNWERGGVPDAEIIPSIADAFGVTTDKLFGRKEHNSLENMLTDELLSMGRTEGFKKGFSLKSFAFNKQRQAAGLLTFSGRFYSH